MKLINSILLTLIVTQELCLTIDAKAVLPASVNVSRGEFTPPISDPKSLVATFKYIRPKTADNGSPFPKSSGYIKGYPIQFKEGYSTITVNNSKNSSDVFVKLYALDAMRPQPVRVFFIRKGEQFTADNIKAGNYDVRYRDLNNGGFTRTETFNIEEPIALEGATRFRKMTLTLYKVPGGKMKTYPLSEQEF